jgi:hypothetical protein
MQRTPGKRDYGSSDSARLRSLASRGVTTSATPKPPARNGNANPSENARPRPRRRGETGRDAHASA